MFCRTVAAIDIASPKNECQNIGWAIDGPEQCTGKNLDEFVERVGVALNKGSVALGIESPLFIPLRDDPRTLCTARKGEGNRPYSSHAGPTSLVAGLAVSSYILKAIRKTAPLAVATFNWKQPSHAPGHLLIYEAFVSRRDQCSTLEGMDPHIADARAAIVRFKEIMLSDGTSAIDEPACLNLLGAILLRTGWTNDPALLWEPCLVVKAEKADCSP